jgi:RHS repeat-associated protein
VKDIVLEASVLGQRVVRHYAPAPSLSDVVAWDGADVFGRPWQGRQMLEARVGYVYDAVYKNTPRFGYDGNGAVITGERARGQVTLWTALEIPIGALDASPLGLGGWTLDQHHVYDLRGRVLNLGTGRTRSAQGLGPTLTSLAGNRSYSSSGDDAPARDASMKSIEGIDVAPDGTVFVADGNGDVVRKISRDGIITRVAGNGTTGFGGDGGKALDAELHYPSGLALGPDGTLYVADRYNHRVRAISPDGDIRTVAGDGSDTDSGAGGLATAAGLPNPRDVAVGPDGRLYIAEQNRVRRIGPDGIITTVAGNGGWGINGAGDGGPATETGFDDIPSIAVSPEGELYLINFGRVRKVSTSGIITTVLGGGTKPLAPGIRALEVGFQALYGVDFGADGRLYVSALNPTTQTGKFVVELGPDGVVHLVAGGGSEQQSLNPKTSTTPTAVFLQATQLRVEADGTLYVGNGWGVAKIRPALPGFSPSEFLIPDEDGRTGYVFDTFGRHLRTLDTVTNVTLFTFTYDGEGRLATIEDTFGNATNLTRDSAGIPTSIVGPYEEATTLEVGTDGYLASITNANGEQTSFGYGDGGLLATLTNPRGGVNRFEYDDDGRLIKDTEPSGAFQSLTRKAEGTGAFSVTLATALARKRAHQIRDVDVSKLVPTDVDRIVTDRHGISRTFQRSGANATSTSPAATSTSTIGGDPRFGMGSPLVSSAKTTMSGGPSFEQSSAATVTLSDPDDPLSLTKLELTTTRNGLDWVESYAADTRTTTARTPAGRSTTSVLNKNGQLGSLTAPGLTPLTFTYDSHGRLSSAAQGVRSATLTYGSDGHVASAKDQLGQTWSYSYDAVGQLLSSTRPDQASTTFSYDASGELTSITPPGKPAHLFSYDPDGRLATYTAPDAGQGAAVTTYDYDKDGALAKVTRPDGSVVQIAYDDAGRPETVSTPAGDIVSTYDAPTGLVASSKGPYGVDLAYTYTGSLLTETTWSGAVTGSFDRTYDAFFRVATETVNGQVVTKATLSYDSDGLVTGVATPAGALTLVYDAGTPRLLTTALGGVTDARTYDGFGDLATYTAKAGSTTIFDVTYTRDALGRILVEDEAVQGAQKRTEYGYDDAGRLLSVAENGATVRTYAYDDNGNRSAFDDLQHNRKPTGKYDAQDRLLTYDTFSYVYAEDGNLRSKTDTSNNQVTKYTYDALGNLITVELPTGKTVEYVIDGNQHRVGKKIDGALQRQWLWSADLRIAAELDGAGAIVSRFVYGNRVNVPEYVIKGGEAYRIITDHVGSVRLVVRARDGTVVQRIDRDEFGNVTNDTNPGFQPFGFAGGLFDVDTGLVRFGARDYEAATARWVLKDRVLFAGQDSNLYAYVESDPVNFVDPFGLMKLPADPGGLGPDWKHDPTHLDPNGSRWRHPSGDVLDFHKGRPGMLGERGRDHWHHNGSKRHLKPGSEVSDPAAECAEGNSSVDDPSDEAGEAGDPTDGNDYYRDPLDEWLDAIGHGWIPIFPMPAPIPGMPLPFPGRFPVPTY